MEEDHTGTTVATWATKLATRPSLPFAEDTIAHRSLADIAYSTQRPGASGKQRTSHFTGAAVWEEGGRKPRETKHTNELREIEYS